MTGQEAFKEILTIMLKTGLRPRDGVREARVTWEDLVGLVRKNATDCVKMVAHIDKIESELKSTRGVAR